MFPLFHRIEAHLLCIFRTQLQQSQFVPTHRYFEFHTLNFHVRQKRHNHFRRKFPELGLDFSDESPQNSFLLLLYIHFESEIEGLHYGPVHNPEEISESLRRIQHQRKHIATAACRALYQRFAVMMVQSLHLQFIFLSRFEVHLLCSLGHQRPVPCNKFPSAPFEQMHDFFYIAIILLFADSPAATALALAYVEIQAGTNFLAQNGLRCDFVIAAPYGVYCAEQLD